MPIVNETMNLRTASAPGLFADDATAREFDRECEAARAQQRVPFAVSPRFPLQTKRGLLQPGAEVKPEDFAEVRDAHDRIVQANWQVFQRLVREQRILERY